MEGGNDRYRSLSGSSRLGNTAYDKDAMSIYDMEEWKRELRAVFHDQPASFDSADIVLFPKVNEFR